MREGRVAILALSLTALLLLTAGRAPVRQQTIGVATHETDGTIVLQLRAMADGGGEGDALVRYPPDDPRYLAIARHVGPIPRGGSVLMKPFGKR